jgi:ABC-type lipoprotein export system ATPase subunit
MITVMKNSYQIIQAIHLNNISQSFKKPGLQKFWFKKTSHQDTEKTIFSGLTLTFNKGISYAIVGASGAGKSTLLHTMAGILAPTSGHVLVQDRAGTFFNALTYPKHYFGIVFQQPTLIDELSVLENIMIPKFIAKNLAPDAENHALELLEHLGLTEYAHHHPKALSVGQQQRVSLARALLTKPSFLLADEPTGALDQENAKILLDLIVAYQKKYGMGLIIASHDTTIISRSEQIIRLS